LGSTHELERVLSAPTWSSQPPERRETTVEQEDVEKTAIETQFTKRSPSEEQKARQKFIALFRSKKNEETIAGLTDEEPESTEKTLKHKPFTIGNQLRATILNSWLNVLLLAVPAGFVVNYLDLNPIVVFFVNFGAILPLTTLFSYAVDEVRLRYKGVSGMLVYMSFG
jgi:Ca2+:H+ antiporter